MSAVVSPSAELAVIPASLAIPWASGRPSTISRLVHGAYHLPGHPIEEWMADLAEACARVPGAVIGLGSSAYFDLLVDVPPAAPCLIIEASESAPPSGWTSCRIVRAESGADLHVGVIHDIVCGVPLRRTSAARTVVDFIRSSSDPRTGLEAARRFLAAGGHVDELLVIADRLSDRAPILRDIDIFLRAQGGSEP